MSPLFFGFKSVGSHKNKKPALRVENLEERRNPSSVVLATWHFDTQILDVQGAGAPFINDRIKIYQNNGLVFVLDNRFGTNALVGITDTFNDSVLASVPAANITGITVESGSGNDVVDLNSLKAGFDDLLIPSTIQGGDGNDTIAGGDGNDSIEGGTGNDAIDGNAGQDTLHGGDGNDLLFGGTDNDTVFGEAGNDVIHGDNTASDGPDNGDDSLDGGSGNNRIYGGGGDDTIIGGTGTARDTLFGEAGNDSITGSDGNDLIYGNSGNDTVDGGAGNDRIFGLLDNDSLSGGTGNDYIDGGPGDDALFGDAGNDTLIGGLGNDTLDGGTDAGGGDIDHAIDLASTSTFRNDESLGFASPTFTAVWDDAGADTLTITGSNGNDSITLVQVSSAIIVKDGATIVPIQLTSGGNELTSIPIGDITGAIAIDAKAGNDLINATTVTLPLSITGSAGNKTIFGGTANDTITTGAGNDRIYGNGGDDTINAGDGNNLVNGGDGNDTVVTGAGKDLLYGGNGDDSLTAGDGNDKLFGLAGDDTLDGGIGTDYGDGGTGVDVGVNLETMKNIP